MRKILKLNRKMITRDNDIVMFKILKKIRLKKFLALFSLYLMVKLIEYTKNYVLKRS